VIFIHAVEVDHGLAAHLVGPDPLVGDQLISFSLSVPRLIANLSAFNEKVMSVMVTSTKNLLQ
jgi:hypothetical protein